MSEVKTLKEKRWSSVDLLFWSGCLLIAAGLGLLWGLPAGMISGGAACLTGSYLTERSGQGREEGGDGS